MFKGLVAPQIKNNQPLEVKRAPFEKPEVLVRWEAPVRVFEKKHPSWFAGLMLISLTLFLLMLFLKQWVLSLLVLAFAFVLYVQNKVEPVSASYQVLTTGIKIEGKNYNYEDLQSFYISEEKKQKVLVITTWLNFPSRLAIVIPEEEQEKIENSLLKYIPYHERRERDYAKILDSVIDGFSPRIPSRVTAFFERLTSKSFRRA